MITLKDDAVLRDAIAIARTELEKIAEPDTVGEHIGFVMLEDRLGAHRFACTSRAYPDWQWEATVARVPRGKTATVCETQLVPGPQTVLAPRWVPYADRLAPGDLGAGDVLPQQKDDPNLEFGFEATGDEDVDQMAQWELGLGRVRVLSAAGRAAAADRWYGGDHGPSSEIARKAGARCSSCGFFLPMAGALRTTFGVCASEWSPSDGAVVSLDHGCGAHSETDIPAPEPEVVHPPIIDDFALDVAVKS